MKISLIGPKWNQMVNSYPPLGLAYLAAVAEEEGHDVSVHDFGLRPERTLEAELADVLAFKPDLVGFTSMTTSHHSVEQAAAPLKEALGVPLVIGGTAVQGDDYGLTADGQVVTDQVVIPAGRSSVVVTLGVVDDAGRAGVQCACHDGHLPGGGADGDLDCLVALVIRQQGGFTRRASDEESVDTGGDEELAQLLE